ncbi:hypothetical protein, partial [Corynebacterium sp. HMSC05E07]|uniref:hypothetical protein n=1 Tax=Corynebacterium sp. HMSC05E07 TaxID=1581117 RepID=UPI001AF01259
MQIASAANSTMEPQLSTSTKTTKRPSKPADQRQWAQWQLHGQQHFPKQSESVLSAGAIAFVGGTAAYYLSKNGICSNNRNLVVNMKRQAHCELKRPGFSSYL